MNTDNRIKTDQLVKKLLAITLLAVASVAIADTVVVTDSKVLQCKTFCDEKGQNCKVICL